MKSLLTILFLGLLGSMSLVVNGQDTEREKSVAREWNEINLQAITNDFARPVVHARNLFHVSAAMYDAWAMYDEMADPWLLGRANGNFTNIIEKENFQLDPAFDREEAQKMSVSYAAYRILRFRYFRSPKAVKTFELMDHLMDSLGYDKEYRDMDLSSGHPADLGNYIASEMISFGEMDGSNEQNDFQGVFYLPKNPPLFVENKGNPDILDFDSWQPLAFSIFIDQSGNEFPGEVTKFLGPEWGRVVPFSLRDSDLDVLTRDGADYYVYKDPGPPYYRDEEVPEGEDLNDYERNFLLVALWSSHLSPDDGVFWDVSPRSVGNIPLPGVLDEQFKKDFYNDYDGDFTADGYTVNPVTGEEFEPVMVPRGDFTRVLAEYWADGLDSETPPGHWFQILNEIVMDDPDFELKFNDEFMDDQLEHDVKIYFALGGAMHDSAIAAWSVKGYYDYIRPISVIRGLAELGQRSDPNLPNYHPRGMPLVPGHIELVTEDDFLGQINPENIGEIKVYTWKGPFFVKDEQTDVAGVDWILAKEWWPYQFSSFVTPPFAGYVSGHSTFSTAAAKVLELFTGSPYFPGGLGEYVAKQNEFLHFEEGPSVDIPLQWVSYYDAANQSGLSRIWGGIHPPTDDLPGRIMGREIGDASYERAKKYFNNTIVPTDDVIGEETPHIRKAYVLEQGQTLDLDIHTDFVGGNMTLIEMSGKVIKKQKIGDHISLDSNLDPGVFFLKLHAAENSLVHMLIVN